MRIITFPELLALDVGEKVPSLRAKIIKVFGQNEGDNEFGHWSIQNLELCSVADPKLKMKVKLFNHSEEILPIKQGKTIVITSNQGEKGIEGISVIQDTYKWKEGQPVKKMIEMRWKDGVGPEIDFTAKASDGEQEAEKAAVTKPAPGKAAPAVTQEKAATPGAASATSDSGTATTAPAAAKSSFDAAKDEATRKEVLEVRRFVGKRLSAYRIVLRAVDKLAEDRLKDGHPLTPDHYQAIAASLFIAGDRANIYESLPHSDLEKFLPKPAAANDGTKQ